MGKFDKSSSEYIELYNRLDQLVRDKYEDKCLTTQDLFKEMKWIVGCDLNEIVDKPFARHGNSTLEFKRSDICKESLEDRRYASFRALRNRLAKSKFANNSKITIRDSTTNFGVQIKLGGVVFGFLFDSWDIAE